MSFVNLKYQTASGLIVLARMSTEEAAVAGTEPTGDTDLDVTAYVSGSRRRHGVHTRGVTLTRTVGTAPDTFNKRTFLAQLTQTAQDALSVGDSVTIGGTAWTVSAKVPEVLV